MADFANERALLAAVRDRLDEWIYVARAEAFEELFEGSDPLLTDEEVRQLDRIDSRLSREEGRGLWGTDEYAIVAAGTIDEESAPRVVCTAHPQVPSPAYPGGDDVDEETRQRLDEALWEYCQRVLELTQQRLEEFVWSSDVATWEA
ncbi:MAG: hypothetical protein ACLFMX_03110 [Halobacteriales archaeon]